MSCYKACNNKHFNCPPIPIALLAVLLIIIGKFWINNCGKS